MESKGPEGLGKVFSRLEWGVVDRSEFKSGFYSFAFANEEGSRVQVSVSDDSGPTARVDVFVKDRTGKEDESRRYSFPQKQVDELLGDLSKGKIPDLLQDKKIPGPLAPIPALANLYYHADTRSVNGLTQAVELHAVRGKDGVLFKKVYINEDVDGRVLRKSTEGLLSGVSLSWALEEFRRLLRPGLTRPTKEAVQTGR